MLLNNNTVCTGEVCRCLGTAWSLRLLFGLLDPEVEGNTVLRKGGVYLTVNTSPVLEDVYLRQHRCTLSLVRAVTWLMFADIAPSWFCRPERVPRLRVFVCAYGRDSRTWALPTYASRPRMVQVSYVNKMDGMSVCLKIFFLILRNYETKLN